MWIPEGAPGGAQLAAIAWLLTYAAHSTLLLGGVWLATALWVRSDALRDLLWRVALVGGLTTATLQGATGGPGPRLELRAAPVAAAATLREAPPAPAVAPWAAAPADSPAAPSLRAASPALALLFWAWAGGAALLLLRFLAGWALLLVRLRRRRPVRDARLLESLADLRRAAGVRREVRLTCSERIDTPVALGRREICLPPQALTRLGAAEQTALLAHELTHLARRDPLWLNLFSVLERALFFQPLHRVGLRRFREAAEQLCDAGAVRLTGDPLALARCVVAVMGWRSASRPPVPLAAMAQESFLARRVRRLLDGDPVGAAPCATPVRIALPAALLLAAGCLAPGVSLEPPVSPAAPLEESFCWSSGGLPPRAACEVTVRLRGGVEFRVRPEDVESLPQRGLFRIREPGGVRERILEVHAIEIGEDRHAVLLLEPPRTPAEYDWVNRLPAAPRASDAGR